MPSKPIYLLATGAVPAELIEEAAGRAVVLDSMDFIDIEYIEVMAELETLVEQPLTVVFTSVHAVHAVRRLLKAPLPEWRVYGISGATCAAVAEWMGAGAIVGRAASATGLAEVIRRAEIGRFGEIVFFCGDKRRDELPSVGVAEKMVYRTVLKPRKVERDYDGIAFFSPSAVESFFLVNAIAAETPLFAIGPTTAAAVRARCGNPVVVSDVPDKDILIRRMTGYFLNEK